VKQVVPTLCRPVCTPDFTLWLRIFVEQEEMKYPGRKSTVRRSTKTGGSDPAFSAFSRPKSVLGSLPPCGACRIPAVAENPLEQNPRS